MKATSNTETEFASGREPNEMSRPTTSTRAGFMESQGCGVHVIMSAKAAIEMGATICKIFFEIFNLTSGLNNIVKTVSSDTPPRPLTRLAAPFPLLERASSAPLDSYPLSKTRRFSISTTESVSWSSAASKFPM